MQALVPPFPYSCLTRLFRRGCRMESLASVVKEYLYQCGPVSGECRIWDCYRYGNLPSVLDRFMKGMILFVTLKGVVAWVPIGCISGKAARNRCYLIFFSDFVCLRSVE